MIDFYGINKKMVYRACIFKAFYSLICKYSVPTIKFQEKELLEVSLKNINDPFLMVDKEFIKEIASCIRSLSNDDLEMVGDTVECIITSTRSVTTTNGSPHTSKPWYTVDVYLNSTDSESINLKKTTLSKILTKRTEPHITKHTVLINNAIKQRV